MIEGTALDRLPTIKKRAYSFDLMVTIQRDKKSRNVESRKKDELFACVPGPWPGLGCELRNPHLTEHAV